MKVFLKADVKNVGKVGEIINVKAGYARNYLIPNNFAQVATEKNTKEWAYLQQVATSKQKKAFVEREKVLAKLKEVSLSFSHEAKSNGELFGSITMHNILSALEEKGFSLDRRDLLLEAPIKNTGKIQLKINLAKGLDTEITVTVTPLKSTAAAPVHSEKTIQEIEAEEAEDEAE
ncbi:MAG: 50S ribosomal protein L9 [Bdellovibrionaceae bacterium]|nr:50S ribosomal protein L9 [Pseudobdellovibrionaceae bacterium]